MKKQIPLQNSKPCLCISRMDLQIIKACFLSRNDLLLICICFLSLFRSNFSLGDHTLEVPFALHKKNRDRLCDRLKKNKDYQKGSIVVLEGGESRTRYSSDTEIVFRQVFRAIISILHLDSLMILFKLKIMPKFANLSFYIMVLVSQKENQH